MKYIFLILFISINSLAYPNDNNDLALREAGDNLGRALYKQYNGDAYATRLALLILDKKYWKNASSIVRVGRIMVEKKVTIEYVF